MSQDIFNPATVFNFFPPVNPIAGTTLNGPEFAIFDTNTSLTRMNFINAAVYQSLGQNTRLDFSPVINAGTSDQMVAWLDTLFLHGSTPTQMKQTILSAVNAARSHRQDGPGAGSDLSLHFVVYVSVAALEIRSET